MKAPELKKIVIDELGNYFGPLGYSRVKTGSDMVASFAKNDGNYYYDFYSYTNKYNGYQFVYGFSFGINEVVEILKEIDAQAPLRKLKYTIPDSITGISPGQLLDPRDPARAYPLVNTEAELRVELEKVKEFYQNKFVPFCEKYSNITELDRLINSPADFWSDSSGKKTGIVFFHVTRLIIARLANNPNFDEVVEKNFQALEEIWRNDGGVYDRTDRTKPEVVAAEYLKKVMA